MPDSPSSLPPAAGGWSLEEEEGRLLEAFERVDERPPDAEEDVGDQQDGVRPVETDLVVEQDEEDVSHPSTVVRPPEPARTLSATEGLRTLGTGPTRNLGW